jgi:hypothetical protein
MKYKIIIPTNIHGVLDSHTSFKITELPLWLVF